MLLAGLVIDNPDHPPRPGWLRVGGSRIVERGEGSPPGRPDFGGDDHLICPGFIDAHVHLPQFTSIGADGLPLLDWLDRVIFPAEGAWAHDDVVDRQIRDASALMLEAGTLGFAGYLTAHQSGVTWFDDHRDECVGRAIVGQSRMDRGGPAHLITHAVSPLPAPSERLAFSVNPRFAVSCSDDSLLRAAVDMKRHGAVVQTHLAETVAECELVRRLFPDSPHYTGVYDSFGLLTDRTLLGHCLHLHDDEWALIADRNSVVVHCPAANTFLSAGAFDLRKAREYGVRLALGSDVAAGPDVAMPRVARAMIEVAKLRSIMGDTRAVIPTPADAWRLITCDNAAALNWSDAGRLEVGCSADILLLGPGVEVDEHLIGRLIYTWRNDYIAHRIIGGAEYTI